jgi:hypothetical protein
VLTRLIKQIAHARGIDIVRARRDPRPWSHTASDYYPVRPRPRWKPGLAPYSLLQSILEANRAEYKRVLDQLESYRDTLHKIPFERPTGESAAPFWNNHWFSGLDAASLIGFVLTRKPIRYIEIGSGHSTLFARYSVTTGSKSTVITSIDPEPRVEINQLCDRVVRQSLENCDLSIFDELEAGDLLFFDGSHRAFTNSDVTVFFFEVLPRLKPGILVHIHDIFLPDDYPEAWNDRFYSEQYLLAMLLMAERPPFRVVLPNYFVCTDPELKSRVLQIFNAPKGGRDIPLLYANKPEGMPGVSFWLETSKWV